MLSLFGVNYTIDLYNPIVYYTNEHRLIMIYSPIKTFQSHTLCRLESNKLVPIVFGCLRWVKGYFQNSWTWYVIMSV
jgi:hypothetical protein